MVTYALTLVGRKATYLSLRVLGQHALRPLWPDDRVVMVDERFGKRTMVLENDSGAISMAQCDAVKLQQIGVRASRSNLLRSALATGSLATREFAP